MVIQVDPGAVVTSTLQRIADVARLIMEHCLTKEMDYRGGLMQIGRMYVSVNGKVLGVVGKWKSNIGSQSHYDGFWEDSREAMR